MRTVFVATACLLVLLAGCSSSSKRVPLAPTEVLHRSVVASNTLDSFSYGLHALFRSSGNGSMSAMSGSLQLTGSLLHERTIATGMGITDVTFGDIEQPVGLRFEAAYAVVPHQRPTIRIDSISTMSGSVFLERDAGSRWISLPLDDAHSPLESTASIDQRWIALQSSAMHVTEDLGLVLVDGRETYHYRVALNVDALEAMFGREQNSDVRQTLQDHVRGELWIDADSFLLRHAYWTLDGLQTPRGQTSVSLDIWLFDQNRAKAKVTPPMPNQIEYPDDGIFATIFSGALLPFLSQ
jgi:hypothetical protein